MDTLSKLLDAAVASGRIRLHHSCSNPVISHLSYADDLLIFFDGSDTSLQAILSVLDDFYRMSGLGVNLLKSTLFLDGNDSNSLLAMSASYGLSPGVLPVKYLGVPLIPHKMKSADFHPLIERIRARFTSWTTRHLSFAGRLQLLQSVISSVINFWASIFLLPNQCLVQIERLCNSFLWSGNTLSGRSAKISWEVVCTPKSSGGLGLRRLTKWNTVLCLKLIWMLFTKSGSLWVSWVRHHLINPSSFWDLPHPHPSGSWMWNRILKLRGTARPFIHCRVGSGALCSFWQDNWTGMGPLISILGRSAIRTTGIPISSSVLQATNSNNWRISSRSRNPATVFLRSNLPAPSSLIHPQDTDTYTWIHPGEHHATDPPNHRFSASKTFSELNPPPPAVSWHKQIWFTGRIPKHAFVAWLAIHDRLPTRARLRLFAPLVPSGCLLCNAGQEFRDHLFFSCPYSFSLLCQVFHMTPTHRDLSLFLQWLPRSSSIPQLRLIAHILLHATIYSIWRERNSRLHTSSSRPTIQLVRDIGIIVRAKLAALPPLSPAPSPSLLETWFGLVMNVQPYRFNG